MFEYATETFQVLDGGKYEQSLNHWAANGWRLKHVCFSGHKTYAVHIFERKVNRKNISPGFVVTDKKYRLDTELDDIGEFTAQQTGALAKNNIYTLRQLKKRRGREDLTELDYIGPGTLERVNLVLDHLTTIEDGNAIIDGEL